MSIYQKFHICRGGSSPQHLGRARPHGKRGNTSL